jgi:hypothetical protein
MRSPVPRTRPRSSPPRRSLPPPCARAPVKRDARGAWGGKTKGLGHYADVNGLKLYYETHGTGRPLVLLHGGLGAIEMFGPNLPAPAKGRQVIAVDLQGHGRTADIDRPLSVELMADDLASRGPQTAPASRGWFRTIPEQLLSSPMLTAAPHKILRRPRPSVWSPIA